MSNSIWNRSLTLTAPGWHVVAMALLFFILSYVAPQFDRKFQQAFHTTPQQFIIKMRVQAACDALRKKESVISEVALDLGFYDQSSFTQHFRKHMGVTPLKYQKRFR